MVEPVKGEPVLVAQPPAMPEESNATPVVSTNIKNLAGSGVEEFPQVSLPPELRLVMTHFEQMLEGCLTFFRLALHERNNEKEY